MYCDCWWGNAARSGQTYLFAPSTCPIPASSMHSQAALASQLRITFSCWALAFVGIVDSKSHGGRYSQVLPGTSFVAARDGLEGVVASVNRINHSAC